MWHKSIHQALLCGLCFGLAGCAPYAVAPQQSQFNPNTQAMLAAQPAPLVANPQTAQQAQAALDQVNDLSERVRRVERAMIRLDRRMQIIERNEMSRLSGNQPGAQAQGGFQPTSLMDDSFIPESTVSPQFAPNAPVRGVVGGMITSPVTEGAMAPASFSGGVVGVGSALSGLPSLADQKDSPATNDLAVWTVNYDPNKIWPTRDQLAASRDIVDSLRNGGQVTVFARGARPSSKVFRERVRAISRYLGRVANVDSIPIASMPAEQLSPDTIEILVTR